MALRLYPGFAVGNFGLEQLGTAFPEHWSLDPGTEYSEREFTCSRGMVGLVRVLIHKEKRRGRH